MEETYSVQIACATELKADSWGHSFLSEDLSQSDDQLDDHLHEHVPPKADHRTKAIAKPLFVVFEEEDVEEPVVTEIYMSSENLTVENLKSQVAKDCEVPEGTFSLMYKDRLGFWCNLQDDNVTHCKLLADSQGIVEVKLISVE